MLSASSTIENFSILTAHVTATGGNYTKAGELWLQANVFSQDYHPLVVSASACDYNWNQYRYHSEKRYYLDGHKNCEREINHSYAKVNAMKIGK